MTVLVLDDPDSRICGHGKVTPLMGASARFCLEGKPSEVALQALPDTPVQASLTMVDRITATRGALAVAGEDSR